MSKTLENAYLSSPVWAQQIMVALYGWHWYHRRYNHYFHQLVIELKERDSWTKDKFLIYQEKQLASILQAAWSAPYYRELFKSAGIRADESSLRVLKDIPCLTKDTLRKQAKNLLTTVSIPRSSTIFHSSGTTGTPTSIFYSPYFHALELAIPAVRNLGWAGVDYRQRRVMFGARKICHFNQEKPPFWRYNPVENMAYASIYHLSPKNLPSYIDFLRNYRPSIIMGYPNSLYTLARYTMETGCQLPSAKGIFTTSETVTPKIRETLEAVWKCKIYDRYGAVENSLFASQCEYGRYHVSPDVGVVEILNSAGEPCLPGEVGRIICTGLHNTLQPLIRYEIGDMACWSTEQSCPCGRHMPILEGIEGRIEDICYTQDGREILRFDTVFKGVEAIREAQIIQEKPDRFLIRVVPDHGFGSYETEKLLHNMQLHVGNVEIQVDKVSSLERTANGKFRAVICHLSASEKDAILHMKVS